MKKTTRVSLIGLWMLLASGFLTRWWLTSPNAEWMPNLPQPAWEWLIDQFDSGNQKFNIEFWVIFGFSFLIVSLLTLAGWFLWRHIKAR